MKRIIRYLIDRAVDRRQPLRGWTAWFVRRDPELHQYEKRMRAVDHRLRKDLDDHLSRPCLDEGNEKEGSRKCSFAARYENPYNQTSSDRFRRRLAQAGVATIVVVAVSFPLLMSFHEKPSPDLSIVKTIPEENRTPGNATVEASFMALDEFRSSLQREGQSVLAQIPRPMELLPKPDRDTIYDSLSATNPICDYFIGCYVRPVFSNASSSFQETGKERNRL